MEYAANLETCLADVNSKGMYWESIVILANQRLGLAHAIAKDNNNRAKEVEAKACTVKEKVTLIASVASLAIKNFKNSEDFKNGVGEAIYNAYLKGFTMCKVKVSEAFSGLDLQDIIAEDEEQEEEDVKVKTRPKLLMRPRPSGLGRPKSWSLWPDQGPQGCREAKES